MRFDAVIFELQRTVCTTRSHWRPPTFRGTKTGADNQAQGVISMAAKPHSQESGAEGQVIIVTGEEDQGQNIVAMRYIGQALQDRRISFHNGCANKGFRIRPEIMADESAFLELLDMAPDGSTFVLADADSFSVIVGDTPDGTPTWFRLSKAKGHEVVLTTVRGVEHKIKGPLEDNATIHINVSSPPNLLGLFLTASSGAMWERIPTMFSVLGEEQVISLARLSDGLYEIPTRSVAELTVSPIKSLAIPVDYSDAVQSTDTAKPKHPDNLMLLTKTTRYQDHLQEQTTEIISERWLEAVNKRRDEDFAVGIIEWTCEKWGIELQDIKMNPETTYPDAWGQYEGYRVNLEVRKVQPKWPSGAPLASIVDIIRTGKAIPPQEAPRVQCKQCGTWEDRTIADVHVLPPHDSNHEWVCTYPKWMIGLEWTEHLTALPNLPIKPGDLRAAVKEAVEEKVDRARRFGEGKQNWLILSVEGFPLDERLHEELADIEWKGLDAVFLILTSQFGSATYLNQIDDNRIIMIARCPKATDHVCYHPGMRTIVRKEGSEAQSLRETTIPRGLVYQVVNADGRVLAEEEREFQIPISQDDAMKGIKRATKRLPFQPSGNVSN